MENTEEIVDVETYQGEFTHPSPRENDQVFISANTIAGSLEEIKYRHIIPVFVKDNEPAISQSEFIEATQEVVSNFFTGEHILKPVIRLSHPIKGRIPEARNKPAIDLLEVEKTLYYERMMFAIEIPSIQDTIDGNTLSLMIGGVKAYNLDNLNSKKGSDEHFKIFIGFKNRVCTNLCVWTDGYMSDIRAFSPGHLKTFIRDLLERYNANFHLCNLKQLVNHSLTERQFATLIGGARMYQYIPANQKKSISPLQLGENQIASVCRDYYRDHSFSRRADGSINLWKLYNLLTGANKSTYIDQFLERSVNSFEFIEQVRFALEGKEGSWYLN